MLLLIKNSLTGHADGANRFIERRLHDLTLRVSSNFHRSLALAWEVLSANNRKSCIFLIALQRTRGVGLCPTLPKQFCFRLINFLFCSLIAY